VSQKRSWSTGSNADLHPLRMGYNSQCGCWLALGPSQMSLSKNKAQSLVLRSLKTQSILRTAGPNECLPPIFQLSCRPIVRKTEIEPDSSPPMTACHPQSNWWVAHVKLERDSGSVLDGAPQSVGRPERELQWQADVCRVRQSRNSGFSAC
jgi:hypothetical protein